MNIKSDNRKMEEKNGQGIPRGSALRGLGMFCPTCFLRSKVGQQVLEYALLISIVLAALTGMYMYGRRGLQAMIKGSADDIGPQSDSEPNAYFSITDGNSTSKTMASDMTYIKKTDDEEQLVTNSVSTTNGVSVTNVVTY